MQETFDLVCAMLAELADELENEITQRYASAMKYPSERRKYERDMEPVRRAREMLDRCGWSS